MKNNMKTAYLFLIGIVITVNIFGQEIEKCNINTVIELRNGDSINDEKIVHFLYAIDKSCKNNVEWSELSNGTLFWLAENATDGFLEQVILNKEKLDVNQIVEEFNQPINDQIDLISIYRKIEKLKGKDEIVTRILESVECAANKMNLKIE